MDLLFQRYASPFVLLDQMVALGKLSDFVTECVNRSNEEKKDKADWEFYLHKVFDKSFEEFVGEMKTQPEEPEQQIFDQAYVETTVQKSRNILKKFKA